MPQNLLEVELKVKIIFYNNKKIKMIYSNQYSRYHNWGDSQNCVDARATNTY